jgi:hypothetical protein
MKFSGWPDQQIDHFIASVVRVDLGPPARG